MPGVPPDAVDRLKGMFKGMFKRGKNKNKQDQSSSYSQSQSSQQQQQLRLPPPPPPQSSSATSSQAAPPQLPPIENASPLNAPDISKPLPPTHPLSTGTHDKPQEAVPQNHDARPGPSEPVVNVVDTSDGADQTNEQEKTSAGEISSLPGSAVGSPGSEPVSALGGDSSPPPPPKIDSAVETMEGEDQTVLESQPTGAKENVQPNGVANEDSPATPEQQTESDLTQINSQTDQKMPVTMEEPPPIKAVRAAPGMSATSGPLEDYPEGGDMRYE